jgi:hypothetical protein
MGIVSRSKEIIPDGMEIEFDVVDNRRHNFHIIDNELVDDERINKNHYAVYGVLARHANARTRITYPSIKRIMVKMKMGKLTVINCLKDLEEWGYIQIVNQVTKEGGKYNNKYVLLDAEKAFKGYGVKQNHGGGMVLNDTMGDGVKQNLGDGVVQNLNKSSLEQEKTTTREEDVVVNSPLDLKDKEERSDGDIAFEILESNGVGFGACSDLIKNYSLERIIDVVECSKSYSKGNRAGWIVTALKKEYPLDEQLKKMGKGNNKKEVVEKNEVEDVVLIDSLTGETRVEKMGVKKKEEEIIERAEPPEDWKKWMNKMREKGDFTT